MFSKSCLLQRHQKASYMRIRTWEMVKLISIYLSLQFLLIFRKAAAGELAEDSGLNDIFRNVTEIDVDETGVSGAKDFFNSKVS